MESVSNGMNLGRYGVEEGGEGFGMSSVFGKGLYQRLAVVGGQASPRGGGDRNSIPVQQFEHIGIALKVYIQGLFTTPQGQLAGGGAAVGIESLQCGVVLFLSLPAKLVPFLQI